MSLDPLGSLDAGLVGAARWFVDGLRSAGLSVVVTSSRRSFAQQATLYASRYSNPYPVARPGTSKHERGLAFDVAISLRQYEAWAGAQWERLGGRWGGRFRQYDGVHFEAPWG